MQKTVVVTVHRSVMHTMYDKRFRVSKKFMADSTGFDLGVGDEVVITECRPLSKNKCFRVTELLKSAPRLAEMKMEEVELQTKRDHRDSLVVKTKKAVFAKS
jgi:small subunit ribosomal protein S17